MLPRHGALAEKHRPRRCDPGSVRIRGGADGLLNVEEQERLLVAHASEVLLMLDGDDAGRKGTDEIMPRLALRERDERSFSGDRPCAKARASGGLPSGQLPRRPPGCGGGGPE